MDQNNQEEPDTVYTENCKQKFKEFIEYLGNQASEPVVTQNIEQFQLKSKDMINLDDAELFYQKIMQKYMQAKAPRKNWADEEINILVWVVIQEATKRSCDHENLPEVSWDIIAKIIPYKDAESCKFKWMSMKKTNLQAQPWNKEEDDLLTFIIQDLKGGQNKWNDIAKELYNRSDQKFFRKGKQCRERWNNYLDPNMKRGSWSEAEDVQLLKLTQSLGCKWSNVAKKLDGRTENAVKNRYKSLIKKFKKQKNKQMQVLVKGSDSKKCKLESDDPKAKKGIKKEENEATEDEDEEDQNTTKDRKNGEVGGQKRKQALIDQEEREIVDKIIILLSEKLGQSPDSTGINSQNATGNSAFPEPNQKNITNTASSKEFSNQAYMDKLKKINQTNTDLNIASQQFKLGNNNNNQINSMQLQNYGMPSPGPQLFGQNIYLDNFDLQQNQQNQQNKQLLGQKKTSSNNYINQNTQNNNNSPTQNFNNLQQQFGQLPLNYPPSYLNTPQQTAYQQQQQQGNQLPPLSLDQNEKKNNLKDKSQAIASNNNNTLGYFNGKYISQSPYLPSFSPMLNPSNQYNYQLPQQAQQSPSFKPLQTPLANFMLNYHGQLGNESQNQFGDLTPPFNPQLLGQDIQPISLDGQNNATDSNQNANTLNQKRNFQIFQNQLNNLSNLQKGQNVNVQPGSEEQNQGTQQPKNNNNNNSFNNINAFDFQQQGLEKIHKVNVISQNNSKNNFQDSQQFNKQASNGGQNEANPQNAQTKNVANNNNNNNNGNNQITQNQNLQKNYFFSPSLIQQMNQQNGQLNENFQLSMQNQALMMQTPKSTFLQPDLQGYNLNKLQLDFQGNNNYYQSPRLQPQKEEDISNNNINNNGQVNNPSVFNIGNNEQQNGSQQFGNQNDQGAGNQNNSSFNYGSLSFNQLFQTPQTIPLDSLKKFDDSAYQQNPQNYQYLSQIENFKLGNYNFALNPNNSIEQSENQFKSFQDSLSQIPNQQQKYQGQQSQNVQIPTQNQEFHNPILSKLNKLNKFSSSNNGDSNQEINNNNSNNEQYLNQQQQQYQFQQQQQQQQKSGFKKVNQLNPQYLGNPNNINMEINNYENNNTTPNVQQQAQN